MKSTDRLLEAIKARGFRTPSEFARTVGIKGVTFRQQLSRQSISKDWADKYCRKLGIDTDWLLYGRGKNPLSLPHPSPATRSEVKIPVFNTPLLKSHLFTEEPLYHFTVSLEWLSRLTNASTDQLAFLRSTGNIMEPTLFTGDLVLSDFAVRKFEGDGIYVVGAGEFLQIKRVVLDATGSFIVRGDNPSYEGMKIQKGTFEIFGKRIATMTGRDG